MASAVTEKSSNTPPSADQSIRVQVVTPERIVVDEWVKQVTVPLPDGEYGIAKNHDPVIARLGFGPLRLKSPSAQRSYFLDGGFLQLRDNIVVILTNKAVESSSLNSAQIDQEIQSARSRPAASDSDIETRLTDLAKLRARLRLAKQSK